MEKLVKQLTHDGDTVLSPKKLHFLLEVLPSQESAALALIQGLLQKTHAQVRYSTILLLDALMKASEVFLDLVAETLQDIVDVLLEFKALKPKSWGLKAYHLALTKLKDWAADYGETRRPFAIAYRHVTQDQGINIDTLRLGMTPAQEARAAKTKSLRLAKYLQVEIDANDKEAAITENLVRLEACLEILCPSLIEPKGPINTSAGSSSYMQNLQSYGLGSRAYALEITIKNDQTTPIVQENEENAIVFDELRETCRLVERRHLGLVSTWVKVTSQAEVEEDKKDEYERFLKRMIDLKARLHDALSTARDILHDGNTDKKAIIPDAALENDSDLSEEEFIDAETEEHPSSLLTGASEPDPDPHRDTSPERIVSPQDDVEDILNTENDSIRKDLLSRAPVVEYAEDLDYWDKTSVPFNSSGLEYQHRFLGAATGERLLSKETLAGLRKRTVALPPPAVPEIARKCGAPLKNGRLCQRKDLERCPIHGPILERDEFGAPLNAFETAATSNMPDWQLLADDVDDIHGPAPSSSKRSGSQLESTREPVSAKKRISKRLARNKGERSEQDTLEFEYKMRDRQAFRW